MSTAYLLMAIDTETLKCLGLSIFSESEPSTTSATAWVLISEIHDETYDAAVKRLIRVHEALPDYVWYKRAFPRKVENGWRPAREHATHAMSRRGEL